MTDLVLHDLDDSTYSWLERRARAHNRGVAEEAAETLRALAPRPADEPPAENLMDLADRLFGRNNGVDLELPSRRDDLQRPPLDFSGPEYDR